MADTKIDDVIVKLNEQAVVINNMDAVLQNIVADEARQAQAIADLQALVSQLQGQIDPNLQAKLNEALLAIEGNNGLLASHLSALQTAAASIPE